MKRYLALLVALAFTGALPAQSTSNVIIDRAQQPAPPPSPGVSDAPKSDDEKGDLDGGVQRIVAPRKLPFRTTLAYDLQIYHTDNVFLDAHTKQGATVVANTLVIRAEGNSIPLGQGLLASSISLVYQRYNHDLFSDNQVRQDLDFDAYSIPLLFRYRFGANWEASFGITGTAVYALEGPPKYNLAYQSLTPNLGIRKLVSVGRNQILSVGGGIACFLTDAETPNGPLGFRSDRNDKIDYGIDAGYYYLKNGWVAGPYIRLVYSDYRHWQEGAFTNIDRSELTGSAGLNVNYRVNRWISARIFASYDWRNSQSESLVDHSYKSASAGLGAIVSITF